MDDPNETLAEARVGVLAALHGGDSGLAHRLVLELLADGYPFSRVLADVLAPIQSESGRRWEVGDLSISEEHVSTAAAETLVSTLAGALDQPVEGRHAVVVCAEGDHHTLPARMAAALLLYEGWITTFLGSSVPADDLAAFLEEQQPDVVVLSCTLVINLVGARRCVEAAHSVGVPVVAGGRAFGSDGAFARAVGADSFAATLPDVVRQAETVSTDVAIAEAGVRADEGRADRLEDVRPRVVRAAAGSLIEAGQELIPARLQGDVDRVFDALVVAAQLDDPEPLSAYAASTASTLTTHGVVSVSGAEVIAALADALEDVGHDDDVLAIVDRAAQSG